MSSLSPPSTACSGSSPRLRRRALTTDSNDDPADIAWPAIVFSADSTGLDLIHQEIASLWRRLELAGLPTPSAQWQNEFTTAVGELTANTMVHALGGVRGEQRGTMSLRMEHGCLVAEVTDNGAPLAVPLAELRARAETMDPWEEHGRGLQIIDRVADSLEYERSESGLNRWTMCKHYPFPT